MNIEIAGVSLYYIISWFFVYSFFGWLWETAYVSVRKRKFVNRGFINGPLCTIIHRRCSSCYYIGVHYRMAHGKDFSHPLVGLQP